MATRALLWAGLLTTGVLAAGGASCTPVAATTDGGSSLGGTPTTEPSVDAVSYTGTLPATTGYVTLWLSGVARRVYVYVPQPRPARPALVVALHGTGANVSDDALDAAMSELGVRDVADANGFIVVAPFSTSQGGANADHETGGDGWNFDGDANSNMDLLLLRAIIQDARRAYDVDATHVYTVGHSNGAFFSYFAAMKLSTRVAAFAENSGGLIACGQRVDCLWVVPGATSCAALLRDATTPCTCPIGASPFPAVKPSGRVPQGFLKHNADDTTVSAVFTCKLADYLGARAQVTIDGAGEHGVTNHFMENAWSFLSARSLGD